MKVIFLKDVPQVALRHDVKEVNNGYARNFLFPKKLAEPATAKALAAYEDRAQRMSTAKNKEEEIYKFLAEKLKNTLIVFKMKIGEKGTAFGSVTAAKIVEACRKAHIEIEKKWIEMRDHIKTTGEHTVKINFPHGVTGEIKIMVEAE